MSNLYLSKPKALENYGNGVKPDANIICSICKNNKAQVFYNSHPLYRINVAMPCKDCQIESEAENSRYYDKNTTSLWKNKQGKEIAVDQRGNQMNNPYKNREFDKHGWMQTSKKEYKKQLQKKGYL